MKDFIEQISAGLSAEWLAVVEKWARGPEAARLKKFLDQETRSGEQWAPASDVILRALRLTPFDQVRVVILGQDPYPTPGHATGLAFGMRNGAGAIPKSLKNIFKEISSDLGQDLKEFDRLGSDLTGWAKQGVLLLNTVLTVRLGANQAGLHRGQGWESLTDGLIQVLDLRSRPVVFVLWGKPAQQKKKLILGQQHRVLEAPHPSPLSAYQGFFGCGHFKAINEFLVDRLRDQPIDWMKVSAPEASERPKLDLIST